jgi:hypothetical protein
MWNWVDWYRPSAVIVRFMHVWKFSFVLFVFTGPYGPMGPWAQHPCPRSDGWIGQMDRVDGSDGRTGGWTDGLFGRTDGRMDCSDRRDRRDRDGWTDGSDGPTDGPTVLGASNINLSTPGIVFHVSTCWLVVFELVVLRNQAPMPPTPCPPVWGVVVGGLVLEQNHCNIEALRH